MKINSFGDLISTPVTELKVRSTCQNFKRNNECFFSYQAFSVFVKLTHCILSNSYSADVLTNISFMDKL